MRVVERREPARGYCMFVDAIGGAEKICHVSVLAGAERVYERKRPGHRFIVSDAIDDVQNIEPWYRSLVADYHHCLTVAAGDVEYTIAENRVAAVAPEKVARVSYEKIIFAVHSVKQPGKIFGFRNPFCE